MNFALHTSRMLGWIGFYSPWLLVWGLGIAIPIAIHFWRRPAHYETAWAAMRFLEEALRVRSKRFQVEQWVLLAIRCTALALLALAVARPFFESPSKSSLVTSPSFLQHHHILVFDNSYSMNRQLGGSSLLDHAKADALRFLETLPDNHQVSVLQMSSIRGAMILANQRHPVDAKNSVQEILSSSGISDVESTRSQTEELLRQFEAKQSSSPATTIRIYSDLAVNTWQPARSESFAKQAAALAANWTLVPMDKLIPNEPTNAKRNSSSEESDARFYPNLGIRDLRLTSMPQVGESTEIEVVVENFGKDKVVSVPIQVLVQGRTIASREPTFNDDSTTTVRIPWTPQQAESFQIEARLNSDALPDDNQRFLIANVRTATRALVIEGEPGDAKYLESALSDPDSNRRRFEFTFSNLSKLQTTDLSKFDLLFLCDAKLNEPQTSMAIEQYVRQGGHIIVWLGPNVDPSVYEKAWRKSSIEESFLPFSLTRVESMLDRTIDPIGYQSPMILPFRDHPESGLLTTPIDTFWQVRLDATPTTIAHLATSSGEPLIVSSQFGQGTAFWWTTGLRLLSDSTSTWNAIAAWPSFVPILQEMVEYVRNHQANQQTVLIGHPFRGSLPFPGQSFELWVTSPKQVVDKSTSLIPDKLDVPTWTYSQTDQVGIYQVSSQPPGIDQVYAVNTDPEESQQEYLELTELESWLQPENIAAQAVASNLPSTTHYEQFVIAALLLVVMTETGLAAWFGIQRR